MTLSRRSWRSEQVPIPKVLARPEYRANSYRAAAGLPQCLGAGLAVHEQRGIDDRALIVTDNTARVCDGVAAAGRTVESARTAKGNAIIPGHADGDVIQAGVEGASQEQNPVAARIRYGIITRAKGGDDETS